MRIPIEWLLEGEPYIQYRARLDILRQSEDDPQVRSARQGMLVEPKIQDLLVELAGWPGQVLASHKSASQSFHKLTFLADLGLVAGDEGMDEVLSRILAHQSAEGPFQLTMNIGASYGGSGIDQGAWALCDAPLIVYALVRFGLYGETKIQAAIQHLIGLVRQNGWPCVVSKELGKWRGPGRKEDPCPFANLAMLKLLSAVPELLDSDAAHTGVETLLTLWSRSLELHPYIFYMGNDFRKVKVPFIWYDLMHVLEVLSQFPWVRKDERFLDMLMIMQAKADSQGRFSLESIWSAWKEWEFGQKKIPSRWLTLLAWRIIQRVDYVGFGKGG